MGEASDVMFATKVRIEDMKVYSRVANSPYLLYIE